MKRFSFILLLLLIALLCFVSCDDNSAPKECKVTFVSVDGGEKTVVVTKGETVAKPDVKVKREVGGFASWRDENNEIYDFNTPVTSDITLTASVWKEIKKSDDCFDEGYAALMLAQEFAEQADPQSTEETEIELKEESLKDIIIYSLGGVDTSYTAGYWVYGDKKYYDTNQKLADIENYLYCEISDKEKRTVIYNPSSKTVRVDDLTISASFSEGEWSTAENKIVKKKDSPEFENEEVSVVISGVDEIVNFSKMCFRFNYTLTIDGKTSPSYVESSFLDNNVLVTYSNKNGDYIFNPLAM